MLTGASVCSPASVLDPGTDLSVQSNDYPFYCPRFWHGMRPATWMGLLTEGRFRVDPSRWPLLCGVTAATPFNAVMGMLQDSLRRADLKTAELCGPPVFIIGHWRSGTTLLHELLVRDERFGSPSTYQCFAPHHFLVTQWAFERFGNWLMPGRRPMDNMAAGWHRPQEDEFAMMNLGMPSPYRRIAFPRAGAVDMNYLDFVGVDDDHRKRWMDTLKRFLATVSLSTGRPLIVKSPTHTGRVGLLLQQFPDAKFIHLHRDPRELYPSTMRLWQSLDDIQGLQRGGSDLLQPYVIECLRRMYAALHRDRKTLSPGRIVDVAYRDLVRNPVHTIETIYHQLHLADFETVRPSLDEWYRTEHHEYVPNKHRLDHRTEKIIQIEWQEYFERYGYE